MKDYLNVANSTILWLSALPVAILVVIQAFIFYKKAKKAGPIVGLSEEEANRAFKIGATSAIGPALGVFVVMLGLMAVIGGPLAWMRLSVIGAAPTELAASQMAAQAQGITLTSKNYNLLNFANATWVMALNGSAWLLSSGLLADKLGILSEKVSKGNPKRLSIIMVAAMCGAFGYLCFNQIYPGFFDIKKRPYMVAAISGFCFMILFEFVSRKHPKFKEYGLGLAMVMAMIVAVLSKKMLLGV